MITDRICMSLVQERKRAILSESSSVEKKDLQGRDVLTLLIKANMARDIPDSQRLSDEEVRARELQPAAFSTQSAHGRSSFRDPDVRGLRSVA